MNPIRSRGIVGAVRPRPTYSERGYPLGECPLCHRRQEAGYCIRCGSSVDPYDKSIRWPVPLPWQLLNEEDVGKKGVGK